MQVPSDLAKTREAIRLNLRDIERIDSHRAGVLERGLPRLRMLAVEVDFLFVRAQYQMAFSAVPACVFESCCSLAAACATLIGGYNMHWLEQIDLIARHARAGTPDAFGHVRDCDLHYERLSATVEASYSDEPRSGPEPGLRADGARVFVGERELSAALADLFEWARGLVGARGGQQGYGEMLPTINWAAEVIGQLVNTWAVASLLPRYGMLPDPLVGDGSSPIDGYRGRSVAEVFAVTKEAVLVEAQACETFLLNCELCSRKTDPDGTGVARHRERCISHLRKVDRDARRSELGLEKSPKNMRILGYDVLDDVRGSIAHPGALGHGGIGVSDHLGTYLKRSLGYPVYLAPPSTEDDSRSTTYWCLLHHGIVGSEFVASVTVLNPSDEEVTMIMETLPIEQLWMEVRVSNCGWYYIFREVRVSWDGAGMRRCSCTAYSSAPHILIECHAMKEMFFAWSRYVPLSTHDLRLRVPEVVKARGAPGSVSVFRGLFGKNRGPSMLSRILPNQVPKL